LIWHRRIFSETKTVQKPSVAISGQAVKLCFFVVNVRHSSRIRHSNLTSLLLCFQTLTESVQKKQPIVSKIQQVKKLVNKKIKLNTKIVFDEDGEVSPKKRFSFTFVVRYHQKLIRRLERVAYCSAIFKLISIFWIPYLVIKTFRRIQNGLRVTKQIVVMEYCANFIEILLEFLLFYDYHVLFNYLVRFWEHIKVWFIPEKRFDGKLKFSGAWNQRSGYTFQVIYEFVSRKLHFTVDGQFGYIFSNFFPFETFELFFFVFNEGHRRQQ